MDLLKKIKKNLKLKATSHDKWYVKLEIWISQFKEVMNSLAKRGWRSEKNSIAKLFYFAFKFYSRTLKRKKEIFQQESPNIERFKIKKEKRSL